MLQQEKLVKGMCLAVSTARAVYRDYSQGLLDHHLQEVQRR